VLVATLADLALGKGDSWLDRGREKDFGWPDVCGGEDGEGGGGFQGIRGGGEEAIG